MTDIAMPPVCPILVCGEDFETVGRWPVVVMVDILASSPDLGARFEFYSGDQLLSVHDRGTHLIKAAYACDGYSPTFWLFGRLIRLTPTPGAGMFPAIKHDNDRQMLGAMIALKAAGLIDWDLPFTRANTDEWFYNSLTDGGVNRHVAGTYYGTVAGPVGSAFIRMTRKQDPNLRVVRIPYA